MPVCGGLIKHDKTACFQIIHDHPISSSGLREGCDPTTWAADDVDAFDIAVDIYAKFLHHRTPGYVREVMESDLVHDASGLAAMARAMKDFNNRHMD